MKPNVTAIFDIGKTNKKFFLFDEKFREVYREYQRFDEIEDDDGFAADNLEAIQDWMKKVFNEILQSEKYNIGAINFSTYGATLVHLDKNGKPVTPLYNYIKDIPQELLDTFYNKYGGQVSIATATASPPAGMLNSGLQLYWLKNTKPEVYKKIRYSLHFPQYLSYLFTGITVSDYTSIGCHTMLWDYEKEDYHDWVYTEGIDEKLPPVVSPATSVNMDYLGKKIKVGVGIHDSSAALLPYLKGDKKPFMLISTGTWSVTLNPFNEEILTEEELNKDCLAYMKIDGSPVKAARIFLGNEYKIQTQKLHDFFSKDYGYHKTIQFSEDIYWDQLSYKDPVFCFESLHIDRDQPTETNLNLFSNFEEAYHRLMFELMQLQVESSKLALGHSQVKKIYIDGGFTDNDIFVKLVSYHFNNYKLRTTNSPLGSALGAAMVISDDEIPHKFLKKQYGLKKHKPLILNNEH